MDDLGKTVDALLTQYPLETVIVAKSAFFLAAGAVINRMATSLGDNEGLVHGLALLAGYGASMDSPLPERYLYAMVAVAGSYLAARKGKSLTPTDNSY